MEMVSKSTERTFLEKHKRTLTVILNSPEIKIKRGQDIERKRKITEQKVFNLMLQNEIIPLSAYLNNKTPIMGICRCGQIFKRTPLKFKHSKIFVCTSCSQKERGLKRRHKEKYYQDSLEKQGYLVFDLDLSNFHKTKATVKCNHPECNNKITGLFKILKRSPKGYCKECRGKYLTPKGEKHSAYNPNVTKRERQRHRYDLEYMQWRKRIYERDDYTCQISQVKGGQLSAHHLYNWADNLEKRHLLENGVTISRKLHDLFHHIYGKKRTTPEMFEEFKQRYLAGEIKTDSFDNG